MIKTLQKKFILTAMLAISILLVVLLGAINVVNAGMVNQQTEFTLNMLVKKATDKAPPRDSMETLQNQQEPKEPDLPKKEDVTMSSRYFWVCMDNSGVIVETDMSHISSVTEDEAKEMAQKAAEQDADSGRVEGFRYTIQSTHDEQGSVAVFLDTTTQVYSMLRVLGLSVVIGLLCWLLMLVLVILLSKRAILPIARNMEKQRQFVTDAGHEIKTPLAIILANTDAMELHLGKNKWSKNIREQTMRLNGLMQNLLTLARMDENSTAFPSADFSAAHLLEESLHPFYEAAALKGIVIETDIQPDVMLHANRDNMARLISILMDNAVKYADAGGQIHVLLKKSNKTVVFQVKNTCAELPKEEPEKLFDRFYRGDSARTQKNGGYGIGLSAARAIAESNRGSIAAEYENQNTIVFTVKI